MRIRCFTIFRIHKYSTHFCITPLLNSLYCYRCFLVISFDWYKEYMICLILFSKFSDVLLPITWTRAIGNLWSICLGVNILNRVDKSEGRPSPCAAFVGNIPLFKALRVNSWPYWKSVCTFRSISLFVLTFLIYICY